MLAIALAALTLTGSVSDPVDGAGTPAQDIVEARSSFDADTGSWSLSLRMRAPVTADDTARVHGILYREDPARPGVCPTDDVVGELGRLEGDTAPGGAEVTLSTTSPAFVGAHPVCVGVTLSKGRPLDTLDTPIMLESGFVPPPPPPNTPVTLAGKAIHRTVRLNGVDAQTAVSARVVRSGRTLARGSGHGPIVRIRLTSAGRRALAHHRRVRARLLVTAAGKQRSFRITLTR